jgi:hypothetical protein
MIQRWIQGGEGADSATNAGTDLVADTPTEPTEHHVSGTQALACTSAQARCSQRLQSIAGSAIQPAIVADAQTRRSSPAWEIAFSLPSRDRHYASSNAVGESRSAIRSTQNLELPAVGGLVVDGHRLRVLLDLSVVVERGKHS